MIVEIGSRKITATKKVLNYLSIIADKASVAFMSEGYTALGEDAREFSESIYNALKERGFYE